MPDTTRSGTEKRSQARCEDAAGVLMAISVISKRIARKLLEAAYEAGKGGTDNGKEDGSK